jgi:hypothetical protein
VGAQEAQQAAEERGVDLLGLDALLGEHVREDLVTGALEAVALGA